jgi:hypothetical protein
MKHKESEEPCAFHKAQMILHQDFGVQVLVEKDPSLDVETSSSCLVTKLLSEIKHKLATFGVISDNEILDDMNTTDLQ